VEKNGHNVIGEWKERDDGFLHCSYCGSVTVEGACKLLETSGTHYSGSDWKYGWPHKFYLDSVDGKYFKFYSVHLHGCSDELFERFAKLCSRYLGITWERDEKGVKYRAPHGFQTWGTV
jgi:hypothetical protein